MTITSQTTSTTPSRIGSTPNTTPTSVATPLPPLNPYHTGYTCPMIAASPQTTGNHSRNAPAPASPSPCSDSGAIRRVADDPLADVDEHHPQRKRLALRAQRVGAAGVAAAERADIDTAAQLADDQTADQRADQIAREYLEKKLDHAGKNISASMQRTLPPLSFSMVGTGTTSSVSVQALRRP